MNDLRNEGDSLISLLWQEFLDLRGKSKLYLPGHWKIFFFFFPSLSRSSYVLAQY